MNKKEEYINSIESELELDLAPQEEITDNGEKEGTVANNSEEDNKSDDRDENEKVQHTRTITEFHIPIIKQKKKEGFPFFAILLSVFLLYRVFGYINGTELNFSSFSNFFSFFNPIDYDEDENETDITSGNINDRVYLSKDMNTVSIYYVDESGKKSKKDYEFSQEAKDMYIQILNNNKFYSRNAQALVICALMTLNKGITYQYGGGTCGLDIGKSYDCSHYIDQLGFYSTGDNLGFGDTSVLLTKGEPIPEDMCQPGDIKLKRTDRHETANHVELYVGKGDDGKEYIIDCSSGCGGVTLRSDDKYPVCVRLNRIRTNDIEIGTPITNGGR